MKPNLGQGLKNGDLKDLSFGLLAFVDGYYFLFDIWHVGEPYLLLVVLTGLFAVDVNVAVVVEGICFVDLYLWNVERITDGLLDLGLVCRGLEWLVEKCDEDVLRIFLQ